MFYKTFQDRDVFSKFGEQERSMKISRRYIISTANVFSITKIEK